MRKDYSKLTDEELKKLRGAYQIVLGFSLMLSLAGIALVFMPTYNDFFFWLPLLFMGGSLVCTAFVCIRMRPIDEAIRRRGIDENYHKLEDEELRKTRNVYRLVFVLSLLAVVASIVIYFVLSSVKSDIVFMLEMFNMIIFLGALGGIALAWGKLFYIGKEFKRRGIR